MSLLYIDTKNKLIDLCQQLQHCEWLALDTEFMREKTYYPKLCLLQVGTPEITACIDPISIKDLQPILNLIYDPKITKVMHACGQDMECFYHLCDDLPTQIFDTQIAAPLLGYPEQAGYARLVEDILNVRLKKSHTRADWSHRPLSDAQLEYAADDVVYLCRLYSHMHEHLEQRGRLDWLTSEFASLSERSRYENNPDLAWRRIKASQKIRGKPLAILQALAAWREKSAQQDNIPRGWLIKDDVLADIAKQQPTSEEELSRIRGLNERTLKRRADQILKIINDNKENTPEALPEYTRVPKLGAEQEALVELLSAVVHLRAAEQCLNPAQLASRKELQRLVMGDSKLEIMQGWRLKLIGTELQSVIAGKCQLQIQDGVLKVLKSNVSS